MSQIHIRRSTPLPDYPPPDYSDKDVYYDAEGAIEATLAPDTFTESRAVVQQFNTRDGTLDCMFTVEMAKDNDKIVLKAFDPDRAVVTLLTYDTAVALYEALSDHLDTLEADIDNVLAAE